jgi:hypothetical protein
MVTQWIVVGWVVGVTLVVDDIPLVLWLSKLLLLLWLNRLLLVWLHRHQLLRLSRLLLLVWGTARCKLPNDEMTSGALTSSMTDVNHL